MKPSKDFEVVTIDRTEETLTAALHYKSEVFVLSFTLSFDEHDSTPVTVNELDLSDAPVLNSIHAIQIATSIVMSHFTVETETPYDLPSVMRFKNAPEQKVA